MVLINVDVFVFYLFFIVRLLCVVFILRVLEDGHFHLEVRIYLVISSEKIGRKRPILPNSSLPIRMTRRYSLFI